MADNTKSKQNVVQDVTQSRFVQRAGKEAKSLQEFFKKFGNDWSTQFAGSLAYSLLTAMLPIAIAVVVIAGFILSTVMGSQNGGQSLLTHLQNIPALQGAQGDLIQSVSQRLQKSAGLLAIIAILLAIFGGSRLFVAIENCMAIIYRVRPRKSLGQNAIAILMMIIFILLVPIMIFAATLPSTILGIINSNPTFKSIPVLSTIASNGLTIQLVGYLGGLLAAFILFLAIYTIVPNQKINLLHSWPGAAVSAIALEIFISLFPLYTSKFMNSYVGQVGFAVVLLAFFYYFAIILLLGAEVNAYFFEGVQPLPNNLATFVSTMAGELNRDRPSEEAPSHQDAHPTIRKDQTHIDRAREQEEKNAQLNEQKQRSLFQRHATTHTDHHKQSRQDGKLSTTVSVIAGSALAFLVEMIRLRQRAK